MCIVLSSHWCFNVELFAPFFPRGLESLPVPRDTNKSCPHSALSALKKQIAPRDLVPRDLLRGISRWKHHGNVI